MFVLWPKVDSNPVKLTESTQSMCVPTFIHSHDLGVRKWILYGRQQPHINAISHNIFHFIHNNEENIINNWFVKEEWKSHFNCIDLLASFCVWCLIDEVDELDVCRKTHVLPLALTSKQLITNLSLSKCRNIKYDEVN